MAAIYANSEEKFLKSVKAYPNASNVLCLDADATKKISKAGLINLFEKGELLVVYNDDVYVPLMLEVASTKATVSILTSTTVETVTTLSLTTFESDTVS